MIEAAGPAQELTSGVTASELDTDRHRRDVLLWSFTGSGEAAILALMRQELEHIYSGDPRSSPSRPAP